MSELDNNEVFNQQLNDILIAIQTKNRQKSMSVDEFKSIIIDVVGDTIKHRLFTYFDFFINPQQTGNMDMFNISVMPKKMDNDERLHQTLGLVIDKDFCTAENYTKYCRDVLQNKATFEPVGEITGQI